MCIDEGGLLAYLDGEVTAEERATTEAHLAGCAGCRETLTRLEADRSFAGDALAKLQPAAEVVELELPPAAVRPAQRFRWPRLAAAAAAVLVVASFAFAPVRTAAADLLRVFRVQKVQTISLSEDDLQQVSDVLSKGKGHVDLKSFGEAWVDGGSRSPKSVTLAQAKAAVDFPVRLPGGLSEPKLQLVPAQTLKFKLKVDAINDALQYYGSDRTIPSSIDGKAFEVRIPTILTATYGSARIAKGKPDPDADPSADAVIVGQARSPELIVPEGVDPAELRDVLLNLPFLPKNVREQLAAVDDWQSTLLVPNFGGTSRDITIAGVPAVLIDPKSAMRDARSKVGGALPPVRSEMATVIWNQDGVVRGIAGAIDEKRAISLAESCIK